MIKKRFIAFFIAVIMCISFNTFNVFAENNTVEINVDSREGAVTLSGKSLPSEKISVVIIDANEEILSFADLNEKIYAIADTECAQNGTFLITLRLPNEAQEGYYKAIINGETTGKTETVFYLSNENKNSFFVDYSLGSDENNGTLSKPFKTIKKAQEAVREYKSSASGDIFVYLKGGVHYLDEPLIFDENDSGSETIKITYMPYNGEEVTISGGTVIDNWKLYDESKNIYETDAKNISDTRQLYVNGERAQRARGEDWPQNIITLGEEGCQGTLEMSSWKNQGDIELVYRPLAFANSRCPVASIMASGSVSSITMQEPAWTYMNDKGRLWGNNEGSEENSLEVKQPWYIENAYELLDEEGEWYLDKTVGKFYYKPKQNEDMNSAYVVAARLEKLLDVCGTDIDNFIHDIEFNGITFAESTWLRPNSDVGHIDSQNNFLRRGGEAEIYRDTLPPAAVTVARARNISFEKCSFTRLGITGINLIDGVDSSTVRGGYFYDISGSAIAVGRANILNVDYSNPADKRTCLTNILINNNYINKVAVEYRSAAAISVGYPIDSEFSHNEISDIPYSGIHIGYDRSSNTTNVMSGVKILNNYIHDILNDEMYDGGAIYTNGATGGSVDNPNIISGNYLKNQYADSFVLYNDNSSQYWHHENNVVDIRTSERTKWINGRIPQWAGCTTYGDYKGISYKNNYTTTKENRVEDRDENLCRASDTHVYPTAEWPKEALDIINNAGLTEEYNENFLKRIDLAHTIREDSWSISGGNIKMQTIILESSGKANYLKNTLSRESIWFNLLLDNADSKAKINLENEDVDYALVIGTDAVEIYKGSDKLESVNGNFISPGKKARVTLNIKEFKSEIKLQLLIDENEIADYTENIDTFPFELSIESQTGGLSFGRIERKADDSQIIKNFSFEQASSFNVSNLTEWHKNVASTCERINTDSVSGNYSAKLTMTDSYAGLQQAISLDQEKFYEFSVWVKLLEFINDADANGSNDYGQIVMTLTFEDGTTDYEYIGKTPLVVGEWINIRGGFHDASEKKLASGTNASLKIRIGDGTQLCTYLMDDFSVKESAPVIENIAVYGNFSSGEKISASYDYSHISRNEETYSYYEIYRSDYLSFEQKELISTGFITDSGELSVMLPADISDSYICIAITPIDSLGLYGETIQTKLIRKNDSVVALQYDEQEEALITAIGAEKYKSEFENVILAFYDQGALVKFDLFQNGIKISKEELSKYTVKAFMWKDFDTIIPAGENLEIDFQEEDLI